MFLNSEQKKRLLQFITDITGECNCKSCQALSNEKDNLKILFDELIQTQAYLIQSEKMAALGKLVAGVIHELNNPIGAINSAIDVTNRSINKIMKILQTGQTIDDIRDNEILRVSTKVLQSNNFVAAEATQRMNRILQSLSSFIRLDESEFQEIDIHNAIESTLAIMNHQFDNRITVIREFGDIPLLIVEAAEINQVFYNLIQNAIHSIKETGTITIRTFMKNDDICIQIKDTGVGIRPEKMKNLFDPDFSKTSTRVKVGMGLFISYHIINKHNGQLNVESKFGRGSTFTILLPKDLDKTVDEQGLYQ